MSAKGFFFSLVSACLFTFGALAGPAQAAPINIINVPADVYAVTSESGGVYAFLPGSYEAMNTAKYDLVAGVLFSGNFPGSLLVGDGVSLLLQGDGSLFPTSNTGLGLQDGNFTQTGGAVTAEGVNGGYGILLRNGSYTLSGGTLTATGGNSTTDAYGIYLEKGHFIQYDGSLIAKGVNNGEGVYLYEGDFIQHGGTITAIGGDNSNISATGIYLESGDFIQNAGSITATGNGQSTRGIYIYAGDFTQNAGEITALANGQSSNGIYLDGDFIQNNGKITTTGHNSSNYGGIESNSFTQNNGELIALGDNGDGIYTGPFTQNNGSIISTGKNGGRGIYAWDNFIQKNGFISAEAFSGGSGIEVGDDFIQNGGILRMLPGDGSNWAVGTSGDFTGGGELQPGVDLAAKTIGLMSLGGGAEILSGATLNPYVINSLGLAKGANTGPLIFLETNNGITGAYPAPANTPTLNYLAAINGNNYELTVERVKNVSDVVSSGNNAAMARSMEKHAAWLFENSAANNRAANLILAYTGMDMAASQGDLDAMARSLTGSEPMRLPWQALQNMDQAAKALTDAIGSTARAGYGAPAMGEGDRLWSAWVTPLTRFDNYSAINSDFEDADGTYFGVSAGAARKLDGGTLGFAAHFIHGDLDNGSDFTSNTVGLNAAFRTAPLEVSGSFTPWLEIGLGYAYSAIDQDRDDFFGVSHDSDFDQHAFRAGLAFGNDFYVSGGALRLTPIIGLDYTYIWQSDGSESGAGLPLEWDSTSLNSLRGKVGGELEYSFDRWAVDAHAFYRYEFLDTYADTTANFVGTPVAFGVDGEDYDPSSGQAGLGLSFDATEDITLSAGYDFIFGDHYQSHGVAASFKWDF